MSTYKAITLHPLTGMPELATWHDDYYGRHQYGVEFTSDNKVFPATKCKQVEIKDYRTANSEPNPVTNLTSEEQNRIIIVMIQRLHKDLAESKT